MVVMKKLLYYVIIAVAAAGCRKADDIILTFDVSEPACSTVAVVCHNDVQEITLDSLGHGSCRLAGPDAAYIRVFYGMEHKLIYAERGDRAGISFTGNDFSGSFGFSGDKAPAVEYLNDIVLTALPDEDYAMDFGEFSSAVRSRTEDALGLLHARNLKGTGKFLEMEEGRIRYSFGLQLLMYPMAHVVMARDTLYRPDEAYYEVIRSYAVGNPMYADIDEYREFLAESAHVLDPANRDENGLYRKSVAQMKFIAGNYTDDKVRQTLLHHIAFPYVENFGTDGIDDMVNIYRTYVTDPALSEAFSRACDKWDRKKPGRVSPDFRAVDMSGKEYSLADFRGKYVYVDIWATWCVPCMRELPHMRDLEKQFEGRNIVFLGLSIDSDKSKWEKKVESGELCGVQLYLGDSSDFLTAYEVRSIPRFILLDPEGRIVDAQMSRPSAGDTARRLRDVI